VAYFVYWNQDRLENHGNDPILERQATRDAKREAHVREIASTMTFRQSADAYLKEHLDVYRNEKHKAQWRSSLDRANKVFGDLNVARSMLTRSSSSSRRSGK
jgi:hypothetical protein